jgi:hypothetical protein
LTFDSLSRKDNNAREEILLLTHTLILRKRHCKQSLHLQKALTGAVEIYAGAASPGRIKAKN